MIATMPLSRLAIGISGAVVGAYCAFTAFRNGQALASGLDGIAFGAAFAAVVVGSWFILPLAATSPKARRPVMRLGWAVCLIFVLVNAIGFTAMHRSEKVGSRASDMTAYQAALSALTAAQDRMAAMKANPRWETTSGCTDATVPKSVAFCRAFTQTQEQIARDRAVVTAGSPATPDAQAETIAWATRIDADIVAKGLPIFMAVILDIAASLFIWAALTVYPAKSPAKSASRKSKASAKPRRSRRRTNRQVAKLLSAGNLKAPRLTASGKLDRRYKAAKFSNDNVPV